MVERALLSARLQLVGEEQVALAQEHKPQLVQVLERVRAQLIRPPRSP